MPVADHRHVHAERGHRVCQRQRQRVADHAADPRQLDRLGKMNAPESGRRDQHQRGNLVAQPFREPGGHGATERMPDQREVVNVERRQSGLHVLGVGGDAVARRTVGVAEAGQIDREARAAS